MQTPIQAPESAIVGMAPLTAHSKSKSSKLLGFQVLAKESSQRNNSDPACVSTGKLGTIITSSNRRTSRAGVPRALPLSGTMRQTDVTD